jgi:hypothetical protein
MKFLLRQCDLRHIPGACDLYLGGTFGGANGDGSGGNYLP